MCAILFFKRGDQEMKSNWLKRIGILFIACAVLLAGSYVVLRFVFSIDVLDRSGWHTDDGSIRYLDYWGRPQIGWIKIEDKQYYFEAEHGTMVTGWNTIDGVRYHFGDDGVRSAGWLEADGGRYYLDDNGIPVTGWVTLGYSRYHFSEDGQLSVGWLEEEGKRYYFGADGVMTVGWLELNEQRFYFTPDGTTVAGWFAVDGVRYQFNTDGSVVTGWYEDDSGRYFFGEDGRPLSGWFDWDQKRYYLNQDGSVTTGWMTVGQDRYYFLSTGRMAIGEVEVDGVNRFFTSKGKELLLCNPWHAVPEDFVLDLTEVQGQEMDRNAKVAFEQMFSDADDADIYLEINNAYRSVEVQQYLWDESVDEYMEAGMTKEAAEEQTGKSIAVPGHSEHATGLAVDINSGDMVYGWLAENCWDYGFILRYPEDRSDKTGIIYEPWHFRYVGTELSLELEALGLCLEEYMTMLTEQQQHITE